MGNERFCSKCGSPLEQSSTVSAQQKVKAKKPGPKGKKRGVLLLVAVLVVALLAGSLAVGLGFMNKPFNKILYSLHNTLEKENFTVRFSFQEKEGRYTYNKISGVAKISIDTKNEDLTFDLKVSSDGDDLEVILYNDYVLYVEEDEDYVEAEKLDRYTKAIIKQVFEDFNTIKPKDMLKFNLETDIPPEIHDELANIIDFGQLESSIQELYKNLNNKKWLAENLGYSFKKSGKESVYRFKTKNWKVLDSILDLAESVFKDQDAYYDMEDEFNEFAEVGPVLNAEIGISKKCISSVEFELEAEEEDAKFSGSIKIVDVGDTNIDTRRIYSLLKEYA